ncbi:hypothetical protein N22_005 [Idiomarinaceae phage 1N2-2]|uniref:hypothetical protein n=1 Tax=Idiomarinaceae phage 1N2-2 TaxID=1536592 RepID=UPI0004F6A522|nr:hypothetical protein N22_005 [Idiomarinaceae phage 1N2-2]AIM40707.1 hypothetical protein N22_005 [Idiomarinaceae phage 1N2-2]
MGKAAKLKELRRLARRTTKHLPEHELTANDRVKTINTQGTQRLGECTRGAYKALKKGKVRRVE